MKTIYATSSSEAIYSVAASHDFEEARSLIMFAVTRKRDRIILPTPPAGMTEQDIHAIAEAALRGDVEGRTATHEWRVWRISR